MLTNNINVKLKMDNIDRDFDVFVMQRHHDSEEKNFKGRILDAESYSFKARAIQYLFGNQMLALFKKNEVNEEDLTNSIKSEYPNVEVKKIDLLNDTQCKQYFFYQNRSLIQLLLNSLACPNDERFSYNNLTGKLYYHLEKDKNFIKFLEIVIEPGMYLNLKLKTFKKCSGKENPELVIDEVNGAFRIKLKKDDVSEGYKSGSKSHGHFTIEYFNAKDYDKFKKSKLGIMHKFLMDVEKKLKDYMDIELKEIVMDEYEFSNEKDLPIAEKYGNLLNEQKVVIVDENKTELSKKMVEKCISELRKFYGVKAEEGKLTKDAYNIRIIFDKDAYKNNDPHQDNLSDYIVQHVIEDDKRFKSGKKESADLKNIVSELIIKGDIKKHLITLYDWEKLNLSKEWTFVIREKCKKSDNKLAFDYYRLMINKNGVMKFDTYNSDNVASDDWKKICDFYNETNKKVFGIKNEVDGLLYSDINNIHAIILTCEKTIPNIFEIEQALKNSRPTDVINKEVLLQAIKEYRDEAENTDNVDRWIEELEANTAWEITKKDLKEILRMKSNDGKKFNRFFMNKTNILIHSELRNSDFKQQYQLENLLDIKYMYTDDNKFERCFKYYVGAKSTNKKLDYPTACCIRKVVSQTEKIEFEEMIPLMNVDFVRNGQLTVLPFPYKYLREYIKSFKISLDYMKGNKNII